MYFDPGTGSMIIQVILGAIPVAAAFFVGLRKKIFKKKDEESVTEENAAEIQADDGFEDIDDE